jgi:uncharacterized protein (TIGR00725 family)
MNKDIIISVSGARESDHCGLDALQVGQELGRILANHHCTVTCGAVTGFPLWVAKGAKKAGANVIAFSPAANQDEHIRVYNQPEPSEFFNLVVYTGFGFSGSDLLMTRSSDAVIFGCGRVGTIHEFTLAFAEGKIIGVLEGPWATDELIKDILKADVSRKHDTIVFDSNPNRLVEQVMKKVREQRKTKTNNLL